MILSADMDTDSPERGFDVIRHQFIRLFLSIIFISLAIVVVQCLVLFAGNIRTASGWKDMVFDDFIKALESSMSSIDDVESSNVMNMMISRTSERISGLLVRDSQGRFVLSLGASPAGEPIPSPEARRTNSPEISLSRFKLSYENSINYTSIEVPGASYFISIHTYPDTGVPVSAELVKAEDESSMLVYLPSIVANQDIAGTIGIMVDGEVVGYIDVLVYRIDYYGPTLYATKELFFAFVISIPVAFIVAAVLAFAVSKANAKSVREIQNSLLSLSRGYFDVDIPSQKTEEMAEIAASITALGKDLSRHQRSRKEWIRNISHDLNTPVTSLNILISGALDGVFPLDKKLIEDMKKENDTLMQRIQSVSYYSFLLSPDAKAERKELSVKEAISGVLEETGLICTLPDNDAFVLADPVLLERALKELLFNATSYSTEETVPAVIISEDGGNTEIVIQNSGHLPNPLPQFFEPWARGDSSRSEGGSGLGLPIVYQIMELHSGAVKIWEEAGCVFVKLVFPDDKKKAQSRQ